MQLPLLAEPAAILSATSMRQTARSGTFTDNLRLPLHRWFRYSAGFSAEWAEQVIAEYRSGSSFTVLDPFAGSGTTLLAAEKSGVAAFGFESHPFVQRIAEAKLAWPIESADVAAAAETVCVAARRPAAFAAHVSGAPDLLKRCYTDSALAELYAMRNAYESLRDAGHPAAQLIWLAVTCVLRQCSGAGTAQWQYVLPNKSKSKVASPLIAFQAKIDQFLADMRIAHAQGWRSDARVFSHDARNSDMPIQPNSIDLVVTSPPYANNYDYADATRLEMMFWGEITGWGDLQGAVRKHIIRSCSQHSAADKVDLSVTVGHSSLAAIAPEIQVVCDELADVRLGKGGKKAYHTMVAAYFLDMAATFASLRSACKSGATMCFVVGDSAPYGVYVPVDRWLGELAVANGFKSFRFNKLRDRNTKWKNRKHTVPLHEGQLWIEG